MWMDDDADAQFGLCKSQAALLLIDGDLVTAEERARGGGRRRWDRLSLAWRRVAVQAR